MRGCIGHLQPGPNSHQKPISLLEATRQAALSSALEDPRFPPVQAEELNSILVEISVLTLPEEITVEDRTKLAEQISVGKDGLIIHGKGWHRGLLLPQVAPEQGWNAEEFLKKMLMPIDNRLKEKQISENTFSFGIQEYIEIPGVEYQRDIGIMGFDVTVVFARAGKRVKLKKRKKGKIPKRQMITKQEIIKFMEEKFQTEFIG